MDIGVVSVRYAKALLAFAKENGKEDQVYAEVKALADHYAQLPKLKKAIENPVLAEDEKLKLLIEVAGGEKGTSDELKRFFQLVLHARRENMLQFMFWSYIDLYREDKHIITGRLITAVPSEKLVKHITELLEQKTQGSAELETRVDPEIIGGYIMEVAGLRLDASIANQLLRVKRQFSERNRRIV